MINRNQMKTNYILTKYHGIILLFFLLTITSCKQEIDIALTKSTIEYNGKEVSIAELSEILKNTTKNGDTPAVNLTVYTEATVGEVYAIKEALAEAKFKVIRQYLR